MLILALAVAVGWGLVKLHGAPPASGRHLAIDGLRGYLALGMLLHHGAVWYFYLHGAPWEAPPSRLNTQLGDSAVALFFMITAFLFTNKLLEAPARQVDWLRLFVGRVMRLAPLYGVVCLLLFGVVAMVPCLLLDCHHVSLHRAPVHGAQRCAGGAAPGPARRCCRGVPGDILLSSKNTRGEAACHGLNSSRWAPCSSTSCLH